MPSDRFDADFLTRAPAGTAAFRAAVTASTEALIDSHAGTGRCFSGATPQDIAAAIAAIEVCPDEGIGIEAAIARVADLVLSQSVVVSDPDCLGHLHCPPLIPGIAAELMIGATNQSMDSWDQAPAATYLEQHVIEWLAALAGMGDEADGIFTSGGTQSNFMALLLARNLFGQAQGWRIRREGMPADAQRLRILCSDVAHFSVQQSAAILGLGERAVVTVPTDARKRMDPAALAATIAALRADGLLPFLVVATAGTTDFGSIDPIAAIADICADETLWLHVDAAFGGGLLLSDRHRHLLDGIGRADSVTVDFHKLFYQPISCATFLVRRRGDFDAIHLHADYLNPEENVEAGVLDLVGKSIQTTRRFDGLKPFLTMQALGRRHLAAMIDTTIALAAEVATMIEGDDALELVAAPTINALVFRFAPAGADADALDHANREIRRRLLHQGRVLLAGTKVDGRSYLKLTMLNPRTQPEGVRAILDAVTGMGHGLLRGDGAAQELRGETIA
ncbi:MULTISPECIES: aspartate aminotransferase family protein [unclassified Sphingomonas]|uniref:pyridoxal phosphate-dependent decarboxylase family protein n=1 Tax=unclassified Sphingomonas TaxID=196159 RepID=UPI00226A1B8C|nr:MULTISPECIES: aspartate aminotransferase family protein [unclassified Sphingomonas]